MFKFLTIISFFSVMTAADPQSTPTEPQQFAKTGDISDEMIPDGWEFVGNATGDINGDGRADMIVVARPGEKPLAAVYWDNGDGQWQLYREYDNAFRAFDQMHYTPEYTMEITENGELKIELYDPEDFDCSVQSSYTFQFKDGEFVLTDESHDNGQPLKASKGSTLKLGDFEID